MKRKEIRKTIKAGSGKKSQSGFSWNREYWLLLAILVLTFLIYSPGLNQSFLYGWDDGEYIDHSKVQTLSSENIGNYFSTFYLGMYQPIPVLAFAVNYHFSTNNPLLYKLFNLMIHLLNVLLVYLFIRKLTGNGYAGLLAALLLAIHPMNVESIAWLSARSTGLFTLFYLLALLAYLRYLQHGYQFKHLGITFLFFLLALFSKSMAATLPMVLFVMDAWHHRRFAKIMVFEKLPFFALSIVFGLISIRAAASFGHIEVLEAGYNLLDRIFLLSYGVAFYLVKLCFPLNLSAIYAYPEKTAGWLPVEYYLSFVLLLFIAIGIYRLRKYRRETFLGFAFFILSISMVLPLFWSRLFIVAERYVYLPYIGLFVTAGIWLKALLDGEIKVPSSTRNWILGITVTWILVFSISAFVRTQVWQNTRMLMEDVIDKKRSPADQAFGWFFLGNVSDREGNIQQAIKDYSRALDHNPKHIQALNNRGIMKGNVGDFNSSLMDFSTAIRLKPDYAEAWYNRGIVRYQTGQSEEACKDWQQAVKLGFRQAETVLNEYCK
ncbi:MAG: tetratricopeptide repeat protein [Bacteroidales bacterium]|nr:tetratricopeptide repeat protein [Bacteroidales bacterium]